MLDSPKTVPRVRFRQIADSDVNDVVELLTRGFTPRRTRPFWQDVMTRLGAHATPPGMPRYGYMLDDGSGPVGVILMISCIVPGSDGTQVRSNVSSWYAEPAFRSYASLLISHAFRHKGVTYINVTPAPHTRPILPAQGYTRYANGVFAAVPPLQIFARAPRTRILPAHETPRGPFAESDRQLLLDHLKYGCLCVWCETE